MDDVRTPRIGKLQVRRWMQEVRTLVEVKDAELLETVELIKELEARIEAPLEKRLAA